MIIIKGKGLSNEAARIMEKMLERALFYVVSSDIAEKDSDGNGTYFRYPLDMEYSGIRFSDLHIAVYDDGPLTEEAYIEGDGEECDLSDMEPEMYLALLDEIAREAYECYGKSHLKNDLRDFKEFISK